MGWEPRAVTEYHYDETGRLTHTVTTTEAEWDDHERGWAEALALIELDTCSGCGQPLSETTSPEAEGDWETPLPDRCHACTALAIHQERFEKNPHIHALRWQVHRKQP